MARRAKLELARDAKLLAVSLVNFSARCYYYYYYY